MKRVQNNNVIWKTITSLCGIIVAVGWKIVQSSSCWVREKRVLSRRRVQWSSSCVNISQASSRLLRKKMCIDHPARKEFVRFQVQIKSVYLCCIMKLLNSLFNGSQLARWQRGSHACNSHPSRLGGVNRQVLESSSCNNEVPVNSLCLGITRFKKKKN